MPKHGLKCDNVIKASPHHAATIQGVVLDSREVIDTKKRSKSDTSSAIAERQTLKKERQQKNHKLLSERKKLQDLRHQKYIAINDYIQEQLRKEEEKRAKGRKKRKKPKEDKESMTKVTSKHYKHEDGASKLDLSGLADNQAENILFSGTDYGVVTMSETVALPMERLNYHLKLYNRFTALENEEATSSDNTEGSEEKKNDDDNGNQEFQKIAKPFKIKAKYIDDISFTRRMAKQREYRKRATEQGRRVKEIENRLKENSVKCTTSMEDLSTYRRQTGRNGR
ncbi:hypothetical protein EC973_000203 [Apophysomyces ossiformis]|uniref:Uncharacterized protein n=1 Tax=Apophysomyces ossiformis TaxID=679940 RepID=A0A8H7EU49_9FUNG|nr:hypothetical protein EC973_000203 [Apophysomyces ossiformis]